MKRFLRKFKRTYSILQHVYYQTLRLLESIVGTALHEWRWRIRHLIKKGWSEGYIKSTVHPHRDYLIKKIIEHAPFHTALEIGCNVGPNLYLLAKRLPAGTYYGIDINSDAIVKGKAWLEHEGLTNIHLAVGKADRLERFDDKSIDVIFTDATLLYIGPDKFSRVLQEMVRVSRRALIFLEFHSFESDRHQYYDARWIHDFNTLVQTYVSGAQCRVTRLPSDLWDDPLWREYGSVIEITF